MAFPAIQTQATGNSGTTAATSHTVTLPSGITSGDLILIVVSYGVTGNTPTMTGYTRFFLLENTGGATNGGAAFYRKADGTEGASATLSLTVSAKAAWTARRISGAADPGTQAPEASTGATGGTVSMNPDALTPTGGAKDYLWFACGAVGNIPTISSFPTSYTTDQQNSQTSGGSAATNTMIASAAQALNAASEDPATYTLSGGFSWSAWTVAVHPSGAGSPQTVTLSLLDQSGTLFAPKVNQAVALSLLDQSATLFQPKVNQAVSLPLLDRSATLFAPTVTDNLLAWYDASAIGGLTDGQAVSTWTDSSTRGNNATQATGSKQPIYKTNIQNGLPVVRFDGTDDVLQIGTNITDSTLTVFVVANRAAVGSGYDTLLRLDQFQFLGRDTTTNQWGVWEAVEVRSGVTLGTAFRVMDVIQRAFNDVDLIDNGTLVNRTNGTALPVSTGTSWVGDVGSTPTQMFQGDVGEIRIYADPLSTAQRQAIETALATKWGIGAAPQTVTLSLLDQSATLFAPKVNEAVALPLLNQNPTLFSPKVNEAVSLPLLSQTPTLFAPTITIPGPQTITLPLLQSNPTLLSPRINEAVSLPLLSQAPSLFSPKVNEAVSLPLLDRSSTLFAPTISSSSLPQTISLPLLSNLSTLFAPIIVSGAFGAPVTPGLAVDLGVLGGASEVVSEGKAIVTATEGVAT